MYEKNRVLLEQLSSRAEGILSGELNLSYVACFNVFRMFRVSLKSNHYHTSRVCSEDGWLFHREMEEVFIRFCNFVMKDSKSFEKLNGIYSIINKINDNIKCVLDKNIYYEEMRDYFDVMSKEDVSYCNGLLEEAMVNLMTIEKCCYDFGIDLVDLLNDIFNAKAKVDMYAKMNEDELNVETST